MSDKEVKRVVLDSEMLEHLLICLHFPKFEIQPEEKELNQALIKKFTFLRYGVYIND